VLTTVIPRKVYCHVAGFKHCARDAEAICEAVAQTSMRFVAVKSQVQQDVLALYRVRAPLIRERTALMNQVRGLPAECAIVVSTGRRADRRRYCNITSIGS
jgi:transposase